MTIEERLKRIEDELSLTEKYAEKEHRCNLTMIGIRYGLTKNVARALARNNIHLSSDAFVKLLIKRGCNDTTNS